MRMTRIKVAVALGAAAACAVGSLGVAGTATADPWSGTQLVAVGSDTIQYVDDALANATLDQSATLSSWDATNPYGTAGSPIVHDTISPKGVGFMRPNGSGEGVAALSDSLVGVGWPKSSAANAPGVALAGQVDIARSSSGPAVSGSQLTYVPFARDAVGVAVAESGADDPNLDTLTLADLTAIYSGTCTAVLAGACVAAGTAGATTVTPYIPQAGSGTRKFFLGKIGVNDDGGNLNGHVTHTIEENSAPSLPAGAIMPFSVAGWIAQNNGFSPDGISLAAGTTLKLASVDFTVSGSDAGTAPTSNALAPLTKGNTPATTPAPGYAAANPDYYGQSVPFARDTYHVVSTARLQSDSVLRDYLTKALTSTAAQSIIEDFGFVFESYDGQIDPSAYPQVKQGGYLVPGVSGYPTTVATPKIPFGTAPAPTISGKLKVGSTVTVAKGTWKPAPSSFTYQWYLGSSKIKGATKASLKLVKAYRGKTIKVSVTGSKPGYASVTKTSAAKKVS